MWASNFMYSQNLPFKLLRMQNYILYCPFNGRTQNESIENFCWIHFPCILLLCAASKIIIWRPIFTKWFFLLYCLFLAKHWSEASLKYIFLKPFFAENFTLFHLIHVFYTLIWRFFEKNAKNHKKLVFWLFKCDLPLNGSKWWKVHTDLFLYL